MMKSFKFDMSDPFGDDFFNSRSRGTMSNFGFHDMGNFDVAPERSGNFVCHSISKTTSMGPDGKPIVEQKIRNKT